MTWNPMAQMHEPPATLTLADFLLARYEKERASWSEGAALITHADFAQMSRLMLVDLEAKRRIVELHPPQTGAIDCNECAVCFETIVGRDNTSLDIDYVSMERWPCETLRLLALPYADHPDYRLEWRP